MQSVIIPRDLIIAHVSLDTLEMEAIARVMTCFIYFSFLVYRHISKVLLKLDFVTYYWERASNCLCEFPWELGGETTLIRTREIGKLRYDCSEDLLDDRKESLKFSTPLDVSSEKRTKYWFSLTIGILTSPHLRNRNSIYPWEIRNFYPVSSKNALRERLNALQVNGTHGRRDVMLARGLNQRFPSRHLSSAMIEIYARLG